MSIRKCISVAAVVLVVAAVASSASAATQTNCSNYSRASANALLTPGAIISNGTVQLGVHQEGHLNVPGGTPSSGSGTTVVGLRYVPTNAESTAPGCLCEGWGVKDFLTGNWAGGNEAEGGLVGNVTLTVESFTSTASTATSVVNVGGIFRVTHDYKPSSSPNLYQVDVTIQNISAAVVDLRYRRVMDWDIEPTAFAEYVTLITGGSPAVGNTTNDGFGSSEPFDGNTGIGFTGEFTDAGPDDHGALFDFNFGGLAPGASFSFVTYYGAADNEVNALAALASQGVTVYSLGQPSSAGGPDLGIPNTFMFGFSGTGGTPLPTPVPVATATPTMPPEAIPATSGKGLVLFVGLLALVGAALLWRARL